MPQKLSFVCLERGVSSVADFPVTLGYDRDFGVVFIKLESQTPAVFMGALPLAQSQAGQARAPGHFGVRADRGGREA